MPPESSNTPGPTDDVVMMDQGGSQDSSESSTGSVTDQSTASPSLKDPYPAPILDIGEENLQRFRIWLRQWIESLNSEFSSKESEWQEQEKTYRAKSSGPKSEPFEGACGDVVAVMAMAVDPVHARLDTGIFKSDPVFTIKPLKKSYIDLTDSVSQFIEFYQRHRLNLRRVTSPRLMELVKHGSMILKTVYDRETYPVQTYNANWKVVTQQVTRFSGPRVLGVSVGDFMFPAGYQYVQDCPIVLERQRVLFNWLKVAEASGKLANVDSIKGHGTLERTPVESERQLSANQIEANKEYDLYYKVYEVWCDFDINNDGLAERLVATYHYETNTFLQLRYNWYFHQRKPYTLIPYTVTNDSLHGIGLGEMTKTFQDSITQWHRMALDNGYLANIQMFISSKDSQIEDRVKMFAGRNIKVNDPSKDLIPFRMGSPYPSTLTERQNLFGLAEKRSGISDYLTGRESPIVGSRATATSTLALIDEGTKRVEQVMENIRNGMAEVIENCIYIWMQYGLDDLDNIVFGDDKVATDVRKFFTSLTHENVNSAIAIDLTTTDAKSNRIARQQVQMSIIQVMMTFYEKFVQLGSNAIQAQMQAPAISALMADVADSARRMFKDLLVQFEVPNPDAYIPELDQFLHAATTPVSGGTGTPPGPNGAPTGQPGIPLPTNPTGGVAPIGVRPAEFHGLPAPSISGTG